MNKVHSLIDSYIRIVSLVKQVGYSNPKGSEFCIIVPTNFPLEVRRGI